MCLIGANERGCQSIDGPVLQEEPLTVRTSNPAAWRFGHPWRAEEDSTAVRRFRSNLGGRRNART